MPVRKVEKHGRTRWEACVYVNGKRKRAYFDRKDDAEDALGALRGDLRDDGPAEVEVQTLEEFAPRFLAFQGTKAAGRRGANSEGEMQEKRRTLESHLLPWFGRMRLSEIDTTTIDNYVIHKAQGSEDVKPLAEGTIANHLIVLRRMLTVAKRWGLVATVPEIPGAAKPKPEDQEYDYLTTEEAISFLGAAAPRWRTLLLFMARTGVRVGEVLALRWRDVDLDNRHVTIRRSVTKAGTYKAPKSGRSRGIDLARDAVAALRDHRPRGNRGRGDALVFCREDGSRLTHRMVERACHTTSKHAKLRPVNPHMLRHTFGSLATQAGVPPIQVQKWMGHSSLVVTERYSHVAPSTGAAFIDRLVPAPDLRVVAEGE